MSKKLTASSLAIIIAFYNNVAISQVNAYPQQQVPVQYQPYNVIAPAAYPVANSGNYYNGANGNVRSNYPVAAYNNGYYPSAGYNNNSNLYNKGQFIKGDTYKNENGAGVAKDNFPVHMYH